MVRISRFVVVALVSSFCFSAQAEEPSFEEQALVRLQEAQGAAKVAQGEVEALKKERNEILQKNEALAQQVQELKKLQDEMLSDAEQGRKLLPEYKAMKERMRSLEQELEAAKRSNDDRLQDALKLLDAARASLAKAECENEELRKQKVELEQKLQLAEDALKRNGREPLVAAVAERSLDHAGSVKLTRSEGDPQLICSVGVYAPGSAQVPQAGMMCIARIVSFVKAHPGELLGIVGQADVLQCRNRSEHPECQTSLRDYREAGVANLLARSGISWGSFIRKTSAGDTPLGVRLVEVWAMGPSTAALEARFAGQFKAFDERLSKVEKTVDGLQGEVGDLKARVGKLENWAGAVSEGWLLRWNGVSVSLAGQTVGTNLSGLLGVEIDLRLYGRLLGIHTGVAVGIGQNPKLNADLVVPQSDLNAEVSHTEWVTLGLDVFLSESWGLRLDCDLGQVSTGEVGTKDEGYVGPSFGARYTWQDMSAPARMFVQGSVGYLKGFAARFENRNLLKVALAAGVQF